MPPPSPVLPSLGEQYGAAFSNSAAQQLRSLISLQQQEMIHPFNLSSSDRKDHINAKDYQIHFTNRSPHQRSSQEYPVFTPVKVPYGISHSYEEFLLGNSIPPESSSKSDDSLEALRDEDWLSPLVLDDADSDISHALDVATLHSLHKPAERLANIKPTALSSATLIHRKKIESRPYHITSIHPNKGPLMAQKLKPRNRSAEFYRHPHQADWNTSNSNFSKKPLSELLSEIAAKKSSNQAANYNRDTRNSHVSHESANTTQSSIKSSNPSTFGADYSDSGCTSCDKCLPGSRVTVVPLMDSRDYTEIPPKERDFSESAVSKSRAGNNPIMSWFRSKKKPPGSQTPVMKGLKFQGNNNQAQIVDSKERANAVKEKLNLEEEKYLQEMAINYMKQEVSHANEKRDAALVEVFDLKMAIEEMSKKLENLEITYCQNLQHASSKRPEKVMIAGKYGEDSEILRVSPGGSQYGATKEEFYHAVTEARVGVKQFCRTLLQKIQEQSATEKIESILQPYNVRVAPRVSKSVRYHLESLINQAFYEDFENIKFQRSGTNCILDPRQRPHAFYKTYLSISQIGWRELVSKESSAYSQSFDGFCDQKMNRVEELLSWEGRWPDELTRSFFVAAKWVWLLHLLAFSFENPAVIFRVGSEAHFDSNYMEELPVDQSSKIKQHNGNGINGVEADTRQIMAMVMPGFFFNSYEVIKCKLLLSRQPVAPS